MPRARKIAKKESQDQGQVEEKVEEKQEKSQPITKPKKYVKKSIDALQRIERSKHQRIFLLSAQRNQSSWSFKVLGTTGSQYNVTTSTSVHCTCFDYRMKKKPCKHIFFIVTQVAQNDQILDYFKSTTSTMSKNAYSVLDGQLTDRLRSRISGENKEAKEIDLKDDTDCTICFTEMDKDNQDLEDCQTCKKYFHEMCISAWKNHNPTCPLCRSSFAIVGDPLSQLKVINL